MDLLRYYSITENGNAKLVTITDENIQTYILDSSKKNEIAKFIKDRLFYRYINPFLYKSKNTICKEDDIVEYDEYLLLHKNGFSMMANSCLLIETIESFYRGWANTSSLSEIAFLKFFGRDKNFIEFATADLASSFYKHIRCGILHQGETTGGWTLTRDNNKLLDESSKIINSKMFLDKVSKSLCDYERELIDSNWNDLIWINAKKKLKAILKNTK